MQFEIAFISLSGKIDYCVNLELCVIWKEQRNNRLKSSFEM